jgi:hypothetical protein
MSKYTEEEMQDLTEEERAALEDLEAEEAEAEAEDEKEEAGEADGGNGDDAEEEVGKDSVATEFQPLLDADAPEDAAEQLEAIARQKEELVQKFDDGELTAKEYQLELDKLAKREREIEQAQFKARLAQEMAEQQQRNAWLATVNQFLSEHSEYRQYPLRYKALDLAVRELAAQEENQGLSGREILEKAHEQIVEQFGLARTEDDLKPEGKKRRKIEAPPTLANVPAASATETEDGRWAKLDRLIETDPERYERELAKLSDADREAYLAAR